MFHIAFAYCVEGLDQLLSLWLAQKDKSTVNWKWLKEKDKSHIIVFG